MNLQLYTPMETKFPPNSSPLAAALALACLLIVCPIQTRADSTALSFTGVGFSAAGDGNLGWTFSLANPITVTQFGVWDKDSDGLTGNHEVTMWDNATMAPLFAQAIPSHTNGSLDNGFRYTVLDIPLLLQPGNYTITARYFSSTDAAAALATMITTAPGIAYNGSRSGFVGFPNGNFFSGGLSDGWFGPNFKFTDAATVPDTGSTWLLLLLAITSVAALNFLIRGRLSFS